MKRPRKWIYWLFFFWFENTLALYSFHFRRWLTQFFFVTVTFVIDSLTLLFGGHITFIVSFFSPFLVFRLWFSLESDLLIDVHNSVYFIHITRTVRHRCAIILSKNPNSLRRTRGFNWQMKCTLNSVTWSNILISFESFWLCGKTKCKTI